MTNNNFLDEQDNDIEQEDDEQEEQPRSSLEQIIGSLCRLCGGIFQNKQLVCYSSFLNLIIKCFPMLNLETYEYFPRQICTDCREKLINFSIFIDKTMSTQAYLIDRFVYNLPNPTNCLNNKRILPRIKQEPICVIKEEIHDRLKPVIHGLKDRLSFKDSKNTNASGQSGATNTSGVIRVVNIPSILRIPVPPTSPALSQLPLKITRVDDDIQILDPAPMKVEEIIEGEDEDVPQQAAEHLQVPGNSETEPTLAVSVVEHNYSKPSYPGKIEILEERVFKTEPFWTEVCDMCGSSFENSRSLELHKTVIHPNAIRVCLICDLAFWSIHEYLVHKFRSHTGSLFKKKKPCIYCQKKFTRTSTRRRHTKYCRLKQKLKCPSCEITVKSTRELITHECLPGDPAKLSALSIDEINETEEIIFITEDGHMIGEPLSRSEVKKLSLFAKKPKQVQPSTLRTEVTVTKQVVKANPTSIAIETGTNVSEKVPLVTSISDQTKNPSLAKINQAQEVNSLNNCGYKCSDCGLKFSTNFTRLTHQKGHRPFKDWNAPCHHCFKNFDTRNDLEQHCKHECPITQRQVFLSKQKPFQCSICKAYFGSHYSLKMHENIHTRALTFPCEYCGKIFVTKQNLIQHLASHSDNRKHSCHLCLRTFKFPSGLRQHINGYHLGIKPHVCIVCKRSYLLKSDKEKCRHSALTRIKLLHKRTGPLHKS